MNNYYITTPFGAQSTAAEVVAGIDLSGRYAIVTGGASGIGLETARALARAGAEVTLAVRNPDAGAKAAEDIAQSTSNARVRVAALDLANQASVATFVQNWNGPLHLLINNAGVIPSTLSRTAEGWELQFATNYLGHFALSLGLHDALASGARERGEARIVSVSSTAHMRSPIVFDDLHFERREYDPQAAYAQSKTADALFAVEATRRWPLTASSPTRSTPAASPRGCKETSHRNKKSTWPTPRPQESSSPKRSRKAPPPPSSRQSPPNLPTPAGTISLTAERPTPCPTTPTCSKMVTASSSGRLTLTPQRNYGRSRSRSLANPARIARTRRKQTSAICSGGSVALTMDEPSRCL